MSQLDININTTRLFIDEGRQGFIENFSNTEGVKGASKSKDNYLFGNWYQGYIYVLLIGIKINERSEYKGKRTAKTANWSKSYISQYKYLLTLALTKPDVLKELGLSSRQDIANNYTANEDLIDRLTKICEKYANAGIDYLMEEYEKDDTIFNDYNAFTNILEQIEKD